MKKKREISKDDLRPNKAYSDSRCCFLFSWYLLWKCWLLQMQRALGGVWSTLLIVDRRKRDSEQGTAPDRALTGWNTEVTAQTGSPAESSPPPRSHGSGPSVWTRWKGIGKHWQYDRHVTPRFGTRVHCHLASSPVQENASFSPSLCNGFMHKTLLEETTLGLIFFNGIANDTSNCW